MHVFRQLFQEYVKGSFHVALMALVFCELTFNQWGLSSSYSARALVFLLTFLAYNGIRYFPFTNVKHELAHFYFVLFTAAFFYGVSYLLALFGRNNYFFCFVFFFVWFMPFRFQEEIKICATVTVSRYLLLPCVGHCSRQFFHC